MDINFNFLMKTRNNLIKMLKYRNIDVSPYENFNQEEMRKMLQQSLIDKSFISPEMGPLDIIVKNRHGFHTYVKYRLDKIKTARAIETFIEQIYETQLKPQDKLILIAPEKINIQGSSFEVMLNNFYNQKGYYVQIISLPQLLINIVDHCDVPEHKVITEKEKNELLEKYYIKPENLPVILRDDAMARYLGLCPGEVIQIIRPSPTSGTYTSYRICV
jgi:DNA-directed RNA polymerase subunit H (RpoH/RPB5)